MLSLILAKAVKDGRISRNAASGVQLPRAVRLEPRFLTAEEVERLVAAAGSNGLSVAVLAFCGLRFGELAALKVRRVNLLRRRLVVAESVTEVGRRLVWSTPKTNRTRTVPLCRRSDRASKTCALAKARTTCCSPRPVGERSGWGTGAIACSTRPAETRAWSTSAPRPAPHRGLPRDRRGRQRQGLQQMLGHASAAMTLDV